MSIPVVKSEKQSFLEKIQTFNYLNRKSEVHNKIDQILSFQKRLKAEPWFRNLFNLYRRIDIYERPTKDYIIKWTVCVDKSKICHVMSYHNRLLTNETVCLLSHLDDIEIEHLYNYIFHGGANAQIYNYIYTTFFQNNCTSCKTN